MAKKAMVDVEPDRPVHSRDVAGDDPCRCPDPNELKAFATGKLSAELVDTIALHLNDCAHCTWQIGAIFAQDPLLKTFRQARGKRLYIDEAQRRGLEERVKSIVPRPAAGPIVGEGSDKFPTAAATPPLQLGDYLLLEKLGQGGMGVVYKARHVHLGKTFALKLLPPRHVADEVRVARFFREIRALGKLDHRNVVRATDARCVDGFPFLVMEQVEGIDVGRLLRELGRLDVVDACEISRQTAVGLAYIHQNGQVHRDIKPSNLMIARCGTVKILDLGLARLAQDGGDELTASHHILGTLDYLPPEQADSTSQADARSDLYGLGCMLYRMLAGQPPFGGREYDSITAKLDAHRHAQPTCLAARRPELPPGLVDIVGRLLEKDPAKRFQTAADLARALAVHSHGSDLRELVASTVTIQESGMPAASDTSPSIDAFNDTSRQRLDEAARAGAEADSRGRFVKPRQAWFAASGVLVLLSILATLFFHAEQRRVRVKAASSSEAEFDPGVPGAPVRVPPPAFIRPGETTARELVFPVGQASSSWNILSSGDAIHLYSDYLALLSLGRQEQGDRSLRAEIRQLDWSGRIGVFYGHHVSLVDGRERATCHVVEIQRVDDRRFRLVHSRRAYWLGSPNSQQNEQLGFAAIDDLASEANAISLELRPVGWPTVSWNATRVRWSVEEPRIDMARDQRGVQPCHGDFGVYGLKSAGTFFNITIDQRRIRLVRDET